MKLCAMVLEPMGGGSYLVWSASLWGDVHILDVAPPVATGMEPRF